MSRSSVLTKDAFDHPVLLLCICLLAGWTSFSVTPAWARSAGVTSSSSLSAPSDFGRPAPQLQFQDYPQQFGESRLIVWIVAQQHLYWAGAGLGVLFLVVILEFIGLASADGSKRKQYDDVAYEILGVIMLAFSVAAVLGGTFLFVLISLYPDLTQYLIGVFRRWVVLYSVMVLTFSLLVYMYFFTWQSAGSPFLKWIHAALGILVNAIGVMLVLLANAWGSFMQSPAGVDQQGRFLGDSWTVLHNALWNPLNVHRITGNLVLGGAVVAAYAAYGALTAKSSNERAHFDWMGYIAFALTVSALITVPFGGYWLSREIYAYNQQMGIVMFGGLLAWLGIMLVSVIGLMFLAVNYYLWQRIAATAHAERYARFTKYVFFILPLCMTVYITPHTVVMTPIELLSLGGQQHPVLGNYGVESAKQTAVNIMIVVTMCSFLIYWTARRQLIRPLSSMSTAVIAGLVIAGVANLLWLGIYGYFIPASVRVGLQIPMVTTTLTITVCAVITSILIRRHDSIQPVWGNLSTRGYITLIFLAFLVTWIAGLGGYRRSALRLFWHISDIMQDNSPWAFTHSVGFAANVITLNAILFWTGLLFVLWLARLGKVQLWNNTAYDGVQPPAQVVEAGKSK